MAHLWLLLGLSLLVGCCASPRGLCVYFDIVEEEIDTEVLACNSHPLKDFEEVSPGLRYYVIHNYNNSIVTQAFLNQIVGYVDHLTISTLVSILVAVNLDKDATFLLNLPPGAEVLSISLRPQLPVDNYRLQQLKELIAKTQAPDPLIQKLVDQVNSRDLRNWLEFLTGELPGSPIFTRNTLSKDAVVASEWIGTQFSSFGFKTSFQEYRSGLGSQAYAEALLQNKTNVFAMIQNDMIAYRAPSTGLLCGFPQRYTTPELTQLAIATSKLYSPTLTTGRNDRCCSDHRSFYERGFPATDFSDTIGPIVDPEYHSSGDIVNRPGFDFEKYSAIVKGIFATAVVLAEPIS